MLTISNFDGNENASFFQIKWSYYDIFYDYEYFNKKYIVLIVLIIRKWFFLNCKETFALLETNRWSSEELEKNYFIMKKLYLKVFLIFESCFFFNNQNQKCLKNLRS
jgi:hypothetical protein